MLAVRAIDLASNSASPLASAVSVLLAVGFNLLVGIACVQAALRSQRFGKQFWTLVSLSFFMAASAEAYREISQRVLGASLAAIWPATIFFFLFSVPVAMTLLLDEDPRNGRVNWVQALDLSQLGIVSLSAFLVFFYIPSLQEPSGAALARKGLELHLVRDGFLVVAFAARGLVARSAAVRSLFRRLAVFFVAYGGAAVLYFYGRSAWNLGPNSFLDLLVGASLVLLVWLASTWQGGEELPASASRRRSAPWGQLVPLLFPFLVLLMASRLAREQMTVAWTVVVASFACSAARILVTQVRQQRTTEALRASESQYRDLVENIAEIVFSTDTEGNLTYVSSAVVNVVGYEPGEILGRSIFELVHPQDALAMRQRFQANLEGDTQQSEWRVLAKNGRVRWLRASGRAKYHDGRLVGVTAVAIDVTERRALEERFLKAFHASPSAMTISRLEDGRYIDVNERWLQLVEMTREQVLGHTSIELGFWSASEREGMLAALHQDGSMRDRELRFRSARGRPFTALMSAEQVEINGEPCVLAAIQDVTVQRQLELQLRQKQKMEAVGRLAGGVAHDFNNLLTVINGYTELMLDRIGPADPLHASAEQIKSAAERASSLTRQLLAFSRQQVMEPRNLNLSGVLDRLDRLLRRLIGEDIEVVMRTSATLGSVKADPGQIEQVVLNLVVNARDAMPNGGKLTLETANVELDEEYVREHAAPISPGPYVMLAVSDTGAGMDSDTQARIFEPFFTTKEAGKGTGLGLATVYGIVKQSNGYIWVYSELGHGTTFKIYLPRVDVVAEALEPAIPAAQRPGSETILLVEDDWQLRDLARSLLSSLGYTVLTVDSVTEVEAVCRRHAGAIHLLLTDVVMPGISGKELARRVTQSYPGTRVLYMSGYTTDTIVHHGVLEAGIHFLQKPFTSTALASKVREVLDRSPAG
jgi:PAS domain S-box-containing protein